LKLEERGHSFPMRLSITFLLFIITEKTRGKSRKKRDGVGFMKDKVLKLEDVKTPHTLG
jgi:hypothetical protein